ncbi:hypothetical protein EFP17_07370 [Burkholderia glumae]|nr:hypothetical protein Y5A_005700 [Burkholderia glumae AU6208]PNL02216.1 hypothetical protein CEQ24_025245 [Burkholderia glumae]UVS89631.1 hypothetical protein EFP17_07370 [Burkholderia glumae]
MPGAVGAASVPPPALMPAPPDGPPPPPPAPAPAPVPAPPAPPPAWAMAAVAPNAMVVTTSALISFIRIPDMTFLLG